MSTWEIQAQTWETRRVLKIADQEIDVTGRSADEVKELIINKARELGWSRIRVLIDGNPVSPTEFNEKFNTARIIEVYKADVAG